MKLLLYVIKSDHLPAYFYCEHELEKENNWNHYLLIYIHFINLLYETYYMNNKRVMAKKQHFIDTVVHDAM